MTTEYQDALFLPATERKFFRVKAGIYTADGTPVPASQCWHNTTSPASVPPALMTTETTRELLGRTLFLGAFSHQFGHFLVESTARLYGFALGDFDQVLMFRQPGTKRSLVIEKMQRMFELFDIPPVKFVFPDELTRVQYLAVPEQGWGAQDLARGSEDFRDFVHERFAKDIAAEGAEKIYISRAGMDSDRGSLISEQRLERHFSDAGFHIYHPQSHPLRAQIAQYKAARVIAGPDGTPFHLVALGPDAETTSVILQRRMTDDATYLAEQMQSFGCGTVRVVPCHPLGWALAGSRRAHRTLSGEVSFAAVRQVLVDIGAIPAKTASWPDVTDTERQRKLAAIAVRFDRSLSEVTDPQAELRNVPARDGSGALCVYPLS